MIPGFGVSKSREMQDRLESYPGNRDALDHWSRAEPLRWDHAAWEQLSARGFSPEMVRDEDLVRVVSADQVNDLKCMWDNPRPGDMLFRTIGSMGIVMGLRRVIVERGTSRWIKLAPKKRDASAEVTMGRVMVNHTALTILSGLTRIAPKVCIIVEGEPDWLTWCMLSPESMVIGIVNGCWNLEIAAFIPKETCVLILTDTDPATKTGRMGAGDRYAAEIGRTLTRHRIFRFSGCNSSDGKPLDQNKMYLDGMLQNLQDIKPFIKSYTAPPEEVVVVKPVDPTAGRKVFGGDQEKRVNRWREMLIETTCDFRSGVYDGDRYHAISALRKFGLAIRDGLLTKSEVVSAIESVYVNGQKPAKAFDRRRLIQDALK